MDQCQDNTQVAEVPENMKIINLLMLRMILTMYERFGEVQSGMLRSGGQGSQEVTGYTVSHFLHVSMHSSYRGS